VDVCGAPMEEGAESRGQTRTTRGFNDRPQRATWRVPCSCLCFKTPVVDHRWVCALLKEAHRVRFFGPGLLSPSDSYRSNGIGLSRGLGLLGPNPIGLSRGLGLSGPKQIGLFRGLGLLGPNPIGLWFGLGLLVWSGLGFGGRSLPVPPPPALPELPGPHAF
jgi:hypothetical protein